MPRQFQSPERLEVTELVNHALRFRLIFGREGPQIGISFRDPPSVREDAG